MDRGPTLGTRNTRAQYAHTHTHTMARIIVVDTEYARAPSWPWELAQHGVPLPLQRGGAWPRFRVVDATAYADDVDAAGTNVIVTAEHALKIMMGGGDGDDDGDGGATQEEEELTPADEDEDESEDDDWHEKPAHVSLRPAELMFTFPVDGVCVYTRDRVPASAVHVNARVQLLPSMHGNTHSVKAATDIAPKKFLGYYEGKLVDHDSLLSLHPYAVARSDSNTNCTIIGAPCHWASYVEAATNAADANVALERAYKRVNGSNVIWIAVYTTRAVRAGEPLLLPPTRDTKNWRKARRAVFSAVWRQLVRAPYDKAALEWCVKKTVFPHVSHCGCVRIINWDVWRPLIQLANSVRLAGEAGVAAGGAGAAAAAGGAGDAGGAAAAAAAASGGAGTVSGHKRVRA